MGSLFRPGVGSHRIGFLSRAKGEGLSGGGGSHSGAFIEEVVEDAPPEVKTTPPPPQSAPVSVIPENAEIVDLTGP